MRRILSICNFKCQRSAFFIAVALVVLIEFVFSILLPPKFFSHEVDSILYEMNTRAFAAEYVLLGDSVGRQLLLRYKDDKRFAMLATNAAVEMTGQYFLIRRFLVNNRPPKAVIFAGLPSHIERNLEQQYTENYVLRTFNNFDEIAELLLAKRSATQFAKSVFYRLFPSYKYRLHLQKRFLGSTNADIYTGVVQNSVDSFKKNYSAGDLLKKFQVKNVSLHHFRKMIELLTETGIPFYYLPVPIKEAGANNELAIKYRLLFNLLASWQEEGLNIVFYTDITMLAGNLFQDTVHFNQKGLLAAEPYIDSLIERAIRVDRAGSPPVSLKERL